MAGKKIQPEITVIDTEKEMPTAQPIKRSAKPHSEHVYVKHKPNGNVMPMARKAAERAVKNHPHIYEIVQ